VEALAASLPAGRILLWLLLVFAAGIAVSLALFLSVPQILFGHATGPAAMRNSLRASLHNAGAVLVYLLLTGIALFAIAFATQIVALIAQMVFGMTAGLMIGQLLMMAVVMPLLAGSVYAAWKQLFGTPAGSGADGVPLPRHRTTSSRPDLIAGLRRRGLLRNAAFKPRFRFRKVRCDCASSRTSHGLPHASASCRRRRLPIQRHPCWRAPAGPRGRWRPRASTALPAIRAIGSGNPAATHGLQQCPR
jgi:hypothetical protein